VAIKIRKKKSSSNTDENVETPAIEGVAEPDAFVETSLGFTAWFQEHWKKIAIGAGVLIVGAIGVSLYLSQQESSKVEASASLNQAALAYSTPTREEVERQKDIYRQQGIDIEDITYRRMHQDARSKEEAVLAAATNTIDNYGDSLVAGEAHLVAAGASMRLGNAEEAKTHLDAAEGNVGAEAAAFVLQARAVAQVEAEDFGGAIESYESLKNLAPAHYGAFALMQIGQLSEWNGDREKAADAYADLAANYPDDPQTVEARRRLSMLVADADDRINALLPTPEAGADDAPVEGE